MKGKCSSVLHKILPAILCVLLFVCTVPPLTFADFESGGGSTRGGGTGRIHDGLRADVSSAPRTGDMICNSCGADYSSDTSLPVDFKCPTCGDYFFSVKNVTLTCWRCSETSVFVIDDITTLTSCPHCGSYMSSIVQQDGKLGYAFKAGGGKTRGGGASRHHGSDKTTVILSAPTPETDKMSVEWPSSSADIASLESGHGMLRMSHAFTFISESYTDENKSRCIGINFKNSCPHTSLNRDLVTEFYKTIPTFDGRVYDCSDSTDPKFADTQENDVFYTSYTCGENLISTQNFESTYSQPLAVFYATAPIDGYYWVAHYPYIQFTYYKGYELWERDSTTSTLVPVKWVESSSHSFTKILTRANRRQDDDPKYSFDIPCSDGIGYANGLSTFDGTNATNCTENMFQTLYSPIYCNKGDHIFYVEYFQTGTSYKAKTVSRGEYPYISYIPADVGSEGGLVYYDWQFDDDDDTYILITYPDPVPVDTYTPVDTYEIPEDSTSDGSDTETGESGHCDHSGIIKAIHTFNADFNNWKNVTLPKHITALLDGIQSFQDNVDSWINENLIPKITELHDSAMKTFSGWFGMIYPTLMNMPSNIYNSFSTVLHSIEDILLNISSNCVNFFTAFKDAVPSITGTYGAVSELTRNAISFFTDTFASFVGKFDDFRYSISTTITDFKAAVVQGFADISANFQLAIDNLNVNITNIFNKKFEDLPEPSPTPDPSEPTPTPSPDPSEPTPSPAPTEPTTPILPDTQKYIIPTMTANSFTDSHGTWIASGSSYAEKRFAYFNAFNPNGFWVNGRGNQAGPHYREMPCWLQIEIPDPENYYVDGYMLHCGPDDNFDVWQILGSNDGETWDALDSKSESLADDDDHKYPVTLHKAYKYYRLYIEHFSDYMGVKQFNLLGYEAADVTIPTPAPSPSPSPDVPDVTPTPAPTDKPSGGGDTNNFWTIIFPNGDDSDDGNKGIFWALISLILALVAFFTNLAAGVGYLFPFLPDGVVMTINACLFVVFLFTIIKFIMRSK